MWSHDAMRGGVSMWSHDAMRGVSMWSHDAMRGGGIMDYHTGLLRRYMGLKR